MLSESISASSQTAEDREARVQALLQRLRPDAEQALRQMAERLADLPEDKCFGQVELDLRDLAHQLAATAHQTGLDAGKKRATSAPAPSARTAAKTPASSATEPRPG